jgi:hypothetical protein
VLPEKVVSLIKEQALTKALLHEGREKFASCQSGARPATNRVEERSDWPCSSKHDVLMHLTG